MQFDGTGLEIHRRVPEVGEHTDEVFGEIGVDAGGDRTAARAGSAGVRSPVPQPQMIWAVGLNYRDHAAETGAPIPARAGGVREVDRLGRRPRRRHPDPAARRAARLRRRAGGSDRAKRCRERRARRRGRCARGRLRCARTSRPATTSTSPDSSLVEVVRHVLPTRSGSRIARRGRSRGGGSRRRRSSTAK